MSLRCDAYQDGNGVRCPNPAKWSVLTAGGEMVVCGVHARVYRDRPTTAAMERLTSRTAPQTTPKTS